MKLNKNLLPLLLFGTLIGLNEMLTGSFSFPYRSVVLSTITIALLSFARLRIPKPGTSLFIMLIAILFKLNNFGFHYCTANVLLCGPTVLLMVGLSFELFASIFTPRITSKYVSYSLVCLLAAILAFGMFAVMNTYIIGEWSPERLLQYTFVKGTMAGIASGVIAMIGIYGTNKLRQIKLTKLDYYIINGTIGMIVIALWLFGTFTKY